MSIFRRRLMFNINKSELPSGYKRVKYLQSTETQYINTQYFPKTTTRWELDVQFTKITGKPQFNGKYEGGRRFDIAISSGGYFQLNINSINNVAIADTERHLLFVDSNKSEVGYDNKSVKVSEVLSNSSYNVTLFARKEMSGENYRCNQKLFSCVFYEKDVVVANMLPCLDSNKIPCMYDVVRKITFYNEGTGQFLYGN